MRLFNDRISFHKMDALPTTMFTHMLFLLLALTLNFSRAQESSEDLEDLSLIGRDPRLLYNQENIPVIRRTEITARRYARPAPALTGHRLLTRLGDGTRSSQSNFFPQRSSQGLYWMRSPTFAETDNQPRVEPENYGIPRKLSLPSRSNPPMWALLMPRRTRSLYPYDYPDGQGY